MSIEETKELQSKHESDPVKGSTIETMPRESPEGRQETEAAALQSEAEKVKNLGILDVEAKDIAAHDRAKADALLTDMKDGRFTAHQDIHGALEARVARESEAAMNKIGGTPEYIDGQRNFAGVSIPGGTDEDVDKAVARMKTAGKELEEYQHTAMQPAIESLAKEKNPIAHSDYKQREAGQIQTFLRTTFPWFPLVWVLPKEIYRKDEGRAAPHP